MIYKQASFEMKAAFSDNEQNPRSIFGNQFKNVNFSNVKKYKKKNFFFFIFFIIFGK